MSSIIDKKPFDGTPVQFSSPEQLNDLIIAMYKHLKMFPEDGPFFIIDPVRALNSIGIQLTDDLRLHVQKWLAEKELYAQDENDIFGQLLNGDDTFFDFAAGLGTSSDNSTIRKLKTNDDDIENNEISLKAELEGRELLAQLEKKHGFTSIPIDDARGYDAVTQISQEAINDIITEAFNSPSFEKRWSGSDLLQWEDFGIEIRSSFDIQLQKPKLLLGVPSSNQVTFGFSAVAELNLEIDLNSLPLPSSPIYEFNETIKLEFGIDVETKLFTGVGTRNGLAAAYIDLVNFTNLKLNFNGLELPKEIKGTVESVLSKIVNVKLKEQKDLASSMDFEDKERSKIPIHPPRIKIIPQTPDHNAVLTILVDMKGTTSGDYEKIDYFLPQNQDFGLIVSSNIIERGWQVGQGKIFPIEEGKLKIDSPDFRLLTNRFYLKAEAHYKVFDDCGASWTIDATAKIWTKLESYKQDGIFYIRPKEVNSKVDMDKWDRFIIETILGALLSLLGVGGPIARSLITTIIMELILGMAEDLIEDNVEGYTVGVKAKIPNTNRIVLSSTPVVPMIRSNGISVAGNLSFRKARS